jgi:protein tyrosine phosphatase (PTP) superfamily phosphohydrolase (DUF442 family)
VIAPHTVLLAIPPIGSFVAWFWYVRIRRRFAAVAPGRVYRSGTLKPRWLTIAVRLHGIRTVIDLRRPGPDVDREREFLRGLGVRHINVCATQRPKAPALDAFLAAIDGAEPPVLLHCLHGAGRARLFSALYRIEYEGWSTERAARSLPLRQRGKRRYLRAYVPRRRGSPDGAPSSPSSASSSSSSRYFPAR